MSLTVSALFKEAVGVLEPKLGQTARFEVTLLIEKHFGLNRTDLFVKGDTAVSRSQKKAFCKDAGERLEGRPLQYILGKWEFYSLPFFVGEGVLIPRPDTELLVDEALKILKNRSGAAVADLCSGTGCIAVAIAANAKKSRVFAFEKYRAAFGYLKRNIALNQVYNVTAEKADILRTEPLEACYDLMVSNPPYIRAADMGTLSAEVCKEPAKALAAGEDGLVFYRRIASRWLRGLVPGGDIILEVGIGQAESVRDLFAPYFKEVFSKKDLGGIDRVVVGTYKLP